MTNEAADVGSEVRHNLAPRADNVDHADDPGSHAVLSIAEYMPGAGARSFARAVLAAVRASAPLAIAKARRWQAPIFRDALKNKFIVKDSLHAKTPGFHRRPRQSN